MVEQAPEDGYLLTRMANDLWDDRKNEEALQYADRAKKIMRHTQRHIEEIKQKEETAENH